MLSPFPHSDLPNAGDGLGPIDLSNVELWSYGRSVNYSDLAEDLSTSSAGELSCLFPEDSNIPGSTLTAEKNDIDVRSPVFDESTAAVRDAATRKGPETLKATQRMGVPSISNLQSSLPQVGRPAGLSASPQKYDQPLLCEDSPSESTQQSVQLIRRFLRIAQPPAAILIGGSKRCDACKNIY